MLGELARRRARRCATRRAASPACRSSGHSSGVRSRRACAASRPFSTARRTRFSAAHRAGRHLRGRACRRAAASVSPSRIRRRTSPARTPRKSSRCCFGQFAHAARGRRRHRHSTASMRSMPRDLRAARALGGALRPIAHAAWSTGRSASVRRPGVSRRQPSAGARQRRDERHRARCRRRPAVFRRPWRWPRRHRGHAAGRRVEVVREGRGRHRRRARCASRHRRRPARMSWLVRIAGNPASPGRRRAARHVRRLVRARCRGSTAASTR